MLAGAITGHSKVRPLSYALFASEQQARRAGQGKLLVSGQTEDLLCLHEPRAVPAKLQPWVTQQPVASHPVGLVAAVAASMVGIGCQFVGHINTLEARVFAI